MGESKSQYLPYQKDYIKCNNFNLNANGFNVNAIPEPLSGLLAAQAQDRNSDIGTSTFGNDEKRFGSDNKDFAFKCVNNYDNELIRPPTPPIIPVNLDLVVTNFNSETVSVPFRNWYRSIWRTIYLFCTNTSRCCSRRLNKRWRNCLWLYKKWSYTWWRSYDIGTSTWTNHWRIKLISWSYRM